MKKGKIAPNGVILESHEIATLNYLVQLGKSIVIIPPSRHKHVKTPDIMMDGLDWEIKCPKNNGARTIEHALRNASKQSRHLIIDLSRYKGNSARAISQIKHELKYRHNIKKLIIITKTGRCMNLFGG